MNFPKTTMVLAVTGGIACGKSEVGNVLRDLGFSVLDTDRLAHAVMEPGTPVHQQIVQHFGAGILDAIGRIDRTRLGCRVFADPAELQVLNRLVHPAVLAETAQWIAERRALGEDAAVLVPLLFEIGWTDGWDAVLCVIANQETVCRRLAARGLSEEESGRRIAAQMPVGQKGERSDVVIRNDGSLDELRREVMRQIGKLRETGRAVDL